MSTFPIRKDEYSVEEISYEDMMTLLASQETNHPESIPGMNEESELMAKSEGDFEVSTSKQNNLREQDELSLRLSENANQSLPAWLLNH